MKNVRIVEQGVHIEPEAQERTLEVLRLRGAGLIPFFQVAMGAGTASLADSLAEASQRFVGTSYGAGGFTGIFPVELAPEEGGEPEQGVAGLAGLRPILITAAEVRLDFGSTVPVTVTPEASRFLARLPWPALSRVLEALRDWTHHLPLKAARATVVSDPEDRDWQELVIELLLEADTETALSLWDEMEKALAGAKEALPIGQRSKLDRHLAVHLLWGADSWHDEPEYPV